MEYIVLSRTRFFFRVPNPDYTDLTDYIQQADQGEKEFIEYLLSLDFRTPNEVVLFKNEQRLGVIGKEFSSWGVDASPPLSIKLMEMADLQAIKLHNIHPSLGMSHGTISLLTSRLLKEMVIFFMDTNYANGDKKLEEAAFFIHTIEEFLGIRIGEPEKDFNC